MKRTKIILVLCFLTSLFSCDAVLEVDNFSTIPVPGFPGNVDEAEAILIGTYDKVRDYTNNTTYYEDRGDSFEVGIVGGPSDAYNQNLFAGNGPNWTSYYSALQNLNILIVELEDYSTDDTDAQQILAEAYFLRAFTYFTMTRIWGEVPIVLEPFTSSDQEFKGRAPVNDVFDQINADLQNALERFPNNRIVSRYRASQPAAYALLADVKMWSGKVLGGGEADFQAAVDAIEMVEQANISLMSDFGDIFDNKANQEIVFSIFFDKDEQAGMYAGRVSPKETDIGGAYLYLNPDLPISVGFTARHVYSPSSQIRSLFSYPDDQREARSFLPILTGLEDNPDIRSYSQTKFMGTFFNNERYFDDDIIVYRLGGLLLLKAEAYAAMNDLANATIALNRVRDRAGIPEYGGPQDRTALEREILDERGRELFLELKRWHDLIRFHHGGTINLYSYVPSLQGRGIPFYWPISEEVIVLNDKIEQTEGY